MTGAIPATTGDLTSDLIDRMSPYASAAYDVIACAERQLTSDEFLTLVARAGRNDGPDLLWEAYISDLLDDATVAEVVGEVWCACEFPDRSLDWEGQWWELFAHAGYTVDGKRARRPRKMQRLYRAAPLEYCDGHSWTEDLETAKSFISLIGRNLFDSQLWQADVEPWRLLARTWRNRETNAEPSYVVNTLYLDIAPAVA
jgi:hypothetical protein